MVAKQVPRIRLGGRTDLKSAIPLDTPIHLFIDPSSACNFKCKFCFDHRLSQHTIMKFPAFKKIISDCKKFPRKIKALRLYGFGEPLLNKRLPEMVKYAKDSGVTDFVEFTTNGWWLSPDLNIHLIESGLDAITISVPGIDRQKIREVCGREVDFDKYLATVKHFYDNRGKCRLHVKMTNYNLTSDDKEKFIKLFSDISDEISLDNIVPIWAGNVEKPLKDPDYNIYMRPVVPVSVCPYVFYHMTIHANGDVSTCFVDWGHKNIIGNVNTESIVDIWNGKRLKKIRVQHLMNIKEGICVNCGQLKYGQADDIDAHADEILKRVDA